MTQPLDSEGVKRLVAYVQRIQRVREEIADLQVDVAEIRKEAKNDGFDAIKIMEVVRWREKVEKHGLDAMTEAEIVFQLYRDACATDGQSMEDLMPTMRDKVLLAQFAGDGALPPPPTRRSSAASEALSYAAIAKMNRGES